MSYVPAIIFAEFLAVNHIKDRSFRMESIRRSEKLDRRGFPTYSGGAQPILQSQPLDP
jgi:hypothetical protein